MTSTLLLVVIILLTGMAASVLTKKLTITAALAGGIIGLLLFLGTGWIGLLLMSAFFMLGTTATSWKRKTKEQWKIAEKKTGRNAGQVLANAGVAGILALLACIFPTHQMLYTLMIAASFSSAAADTLSSELGSVYGKRFYHILSFKKDERGLDGVVSVEGFLFGLAGSAIIALIYALWYEWNMMFLNILIAGTAGNIFDSVLGAAWERKGWIKNDAVNFLNTALAALVSLAWVYV